MLIIRITPTTETPQTGYQYEHRLTDAMDLSERGVSFYDATNGTFYPSVYMPMAHKPIVLGLAVEHADAYYRLFREDV